MALPNSESNFFFAFEEANRIIVDAVTSNRIEHFQWLDEVLDEACRQLWADDSAAAATTCTDAASAAGGSPSRGADSLGGATTSSSGHDGHRLLRTPSVKRRQQRQEEELAKRQRREDELNSSLLLEAAKTVRSGRAAAKLASMRNRQLTGGSLSRKLRRPRSSMLQAQRDLERSVLFSAAAVKREEQPELVDGDSSSQDGEGAAPQLLPPPAKRRKSRKTARQRQSRASTRASSSRLAKTREMERCNVSSSSDSEQRAGGSRPAVPVAPKATYDGGASVAADDGTANADGDVQMSPPEVATDAVTAARSAGVVEPVEVPQQLEDIGRKEQSSSSQSSRRSARKRSCSRERPTVAASLKEVTAEYVDEGMAKKKTKLSATPGVLDDVVAAGSEVVVTSALAADGDECQQTGAGTTRRSRSLASRDRCVSGDTAARDDAADGQRRVSSRRRTKTVDAAVTAPPSARARASRSAPVSPAAAVDANRGATRTVAGTAAGVAVTTVAAAEVAVKSTVAAEVPTQPHRRMTRTKASVAIVSLAAAAANGSDTVTSSDEQPTATSVEPRGARRATRSVARAVQPASTTDDEKKTRATRSRLVTKTNAVVADPSSATSEEEFMSAASSRRATRTVTAASVASAAEVHSSTTSEEEQVSAPRTRRATRSVAVAVVTPPVVSVSNEDDASSSAAGGDTTAASEADEVSGETSSSSSTGKRGAAAARYAVTSDMTSASDGSPAVEATAGGDLKRSAAVGAAAETDDAGWEDAKSPQRTARKPKWTPVLTRSTSAVKHRLVASGGGARTRGANILMGVEGGSFIQKAVVAKPSVEEQDLRRREELQRKREREEEALKKRDELMKQRAEADRVKREERQRRAMEMRQRKEEEVRQAQHRRQQERTERQDSAQQAADLRRREDALRRQRQQQERQREAEEKRRVEQQEQLRRLKAHEEAEAARKQKALEEAEAARRQKVLEEAEAVRRHKALEETEAARRLKLDAVRRAQEAARTAAAPSQEKAARVLPAPLKLVHQNPLLKNVGAPASHHQPKHDLNSTFNKDAETPESGVDAYNMTPRFEEISPVPLRNADDYDIQDLKSDDDTDDESRPRKIIPKWAQGSTLQASLIAQHYSTQHVPDLFPPEELFLPIRLEDMFSITRRKFYKRTSSANWDTPPSRRHC